MISYHIIESNRSGNRETERCIGCCGEEEWDPFFKVLSAAPWNLSVNNNTGIDRQASDIQRNCNISPDTNGYASYVFPFALAGTEETRGGGGNTMDWICKWQKRSSF